jgi:predicted DNA-binding transcriptional regulator YafY
MAYRDGLTKADRLVELQYLFWRNPARTLTTAEIATRLGAAPRTVRKYVAELSVNGRLPVVREHRGWQLAEDARLETLPVRFQLEQAAALYLAGRLLLATADEPNRAVHGAISRLATVLPKEIRPFLDRLATRGTTGDAVFATVFQAIAHGWALQRAVRVEYNARIHPGKPLHCRVEPYLLDASAAGRALYVIGRVDPPGELRVLKLERIQHAELTLDTFTAPAVDEILDRLDAAWGIWLSDEEPVEVVLRFDNAVAARVRETRWHASQRLETLADGGVGMTLRLASSLEIVPWILGWGSHCEVIEPQDVRHQVAEDLVRAAEIYR